MSEVSWCDVEGFDDDDGQKYNQKKRYDSFNYLKKYIK